MDSGDQLRAGLDAALQRESARIGQPLRWDEREQEHIDAAAQAANHVEALQGLLDAELAGDRRPTTVVKLMAEIRLQRQAISDHLSRLSVGDLAAAGKSQQHRAAAVARWGENRPRKRGA
ncbi:hypothetical protein ABQE93_24380 [Mycolicibacterium sp. XJ662]